MHVVKTVGVAGLPPPPSRRLIVHPSRQRHNTCASSRRGRGARAANGERTGAALRHHGRAGAPAPLEEQVGGAASPLPPTSCSGPWCGDSFHGAHAHRRVVGGREYDAGDGGRAQAARLSPLGALISCVVTPRAAQCGPSIQPPHVAVETRMVRTAVSSRPSNIFPSAEHRSPGRYTQDIERKKSHGLGVRSGPARGT